MYLSHMASLTVLLAVVALSGCASTQPMRYREISSATAMTTNASNVDGHTPFSYCRNNVDWNNYSAYVLDPVTIYAGPDGQFDKLSDIDKAALVTYAHDQISSALSKQFQLAAAPASNVLRIHVTLTGAETSTPVISTVTKVIPVGAVVNTALWMLDKQAPFTGSVTYVVEIYDSTTGNLLDAFIAKQYPAAMNIFATFESLDAAKAGIRTGAKQLAGTLANFGVLAIGGKLNISPLP